MQFTIRAIEDIYTIQFVYDQYDEVVIDTSLLKYLGVMRYAIKYAFWALKINGSLIIEEDFSKNSKASHKRIAFWQVRLEFFKSLGDDIELVELDDSKGYLKAKKIQDRYTNNGFSFGIIYGAANNEEEQLTNSILSILENINLNHYEYEILICGPSNFEANDYLTQFNSKNIYYIPYDLTSNKRFLITAKKNYLFLQTKYNIVAISHTRILYAKDFAMETFKKKFDLSTTKVLVDQKGSKEKYLDFSLITSYDIIKYPVDGIPAGNITHDFLYYMQKRVPYIDGGLTIFNKNIILESPYNDKIAWGEAEDVEMCASMYFKGLLIDYFDSIESESSTCKIKIKTSLRYKIKRYISNFLIRNGLL
ncbi:MAG: hypothetical protein PHQ90_01510 [Sulfuricurvum sp.]|uniref:hypothetical protein n=1 Tax=Sulfuricurvum sp. TaxID=2025608 RepID=UPI002629265C|nr:hypothetical protein [Sulfuricurvum sp.]MDD2367946.1 hypothetical protein [Sulfuricurvum sp.]MDD2950987.1 hypothetical protein [Sulfuricurvum sp.]MDD5117474.1 hypothetical protein [Sulfuricurvum sp.]